LKTQREPEAFQPRLPRLQTDIVIEWADGMALVLVIDRQFP